SVKYARTLLDARDAFLARPAGTVVGEQREEWVGGQRLRAEHARTLPPARVDQLKRDDGVDGRLPDHRLRAVLGHRPGVVHDMVEVDLPRAAVGARALRPGARARQAGHLGAKARRVA